MMIEKIESKEVPAAVGPYSQALACGGFIFVSGQLPIDPADGSMAPDIEGQTRRSLQNLEAVLKEAGSSLDKVLKTTVLLNDIADFGKMNEVYASFFTGVCPARVCFQAAALPKGALVEIDAVAVK